MPKNRLYILCGLPYSGKTTLTKKLVELNGWQPVSVDAIMKRENMWRKGHPTQADWDFAYSEAYRQIEKYLTTGENVIFDCANLPKHERQNPKNIAAKLGYESKLIYLNISREEILNRRQANEISQERGQLDEGQMNEAFRLFEEPTTDEEPIIYDRRLDLTKWTKEKLI